MQAVADALTAHGFAAHAEGRNDQLRIIKRLIKSLELDDDRWAAREIQYFINGQKDEGLRPQHLDDDNDPNRRQQIDLYRRYQEICDRGGLVDFAELLLRAHEVLRDNAELLAFYQRRFRHLLVDGGDIIKVKEDLFFDAAAVAGLQDRLVSFLQENEEITTPQFKDMTGASRKYVIPLIEYFDSKNVTIRIGDIRKLRKAT